mgnify:CR=1 FL=1
MGCRECIGNQAAFFPKLIRLCVASRPSFNKDTGAKIPSWRNPVFQILSTIYREFHVLSGNILKIENIHCDIASFRL